MAQLQFWFDYSCPYAYLASTQVEAIAARTDAELIPKPMLLGGLFRHWALSQKLFATFGAEKTQHTARDLQRWATVFGAVLNMPAEHPYRTVDALRATLIAGPTMPLIHAFYRAYWVDNRDLADRNVIRAVLAEQGHDAEGVVGRLDDAAVKDDLRQRTDAAIALGFWGAPSFVVQSAATSDAPQIFWGQDRLQQVEAALGGTPPPLYTPGPMAPVAVYFDYSSPFAYFGMSISESVFGAAATYHPMLLGAVFKAVGQENVPMFVMNEAKRRYYVRDMERFSETRGVPFAFPANFPLRSVLPLRVTMAARAHQAAGQPLVHGLYRAYWADGRDISQPEVITEVCADTGHDGPGLLEAADTPRIKDELRAATEAAVGAGVFGAPTFVVRSPNGEPGLFWGVDRIELAARAARGDAALV